MYSVNNTLQRSFGAFSKFSSYICLSSSCACDFSSSSFSLFCCSRLEIRALHLLFYHIFCFSPARSLSFFQDCLTAATMCGVMSTFFISIPAFQMASPTLCNNSYFKHTVYYQFFVDEKTTLHCSIAIQQYHYQFHQCPQSLAVWMQICS